MEPLESCTTAAGDCVGKYWSGAAETGVHWCAQCAQWSVRGRVANRHGEVLADRIAIVDH